MLHIVTETKPDYVSLQWPVVRYALRDHAAQRALAATPRSLRGLSKLPTKLAGPTLRLCRIAGVLKLDALGMGLRTRR